MLFSPPEEVAVLWLSLQFLLVPVNTVREMSERANASTRKKRDGACGQTQQRLSLNSDWPQVDRREFRRIHSPNQWLMVDG